MNPLELLAIREVDEAAQAEQMPARLKPRLQGMLELDAR